MKHSLFVIRKKRAELLEAYIAHLRDLDEKDRKNWAHIVNTLREAGIQREQLMKELGCALSTIIRWEAGDTAPGPFAREALKTRFLTILAGSVIALRQTPLQKRQRIGAADRLSR